MLTNPLDMARNVAFRYIGYAPRSRAELEKRLERDAFPPEIVAQVVGEMEGFGYLNDTKLAEDWIADRADRKRYGRTRLAAEMRRKGIDTETVDAALEQIDEEDEVRRAYEAAKPRWSALDFEALNPEEKTAEKRKIAAFLQRRGFQWEIIKKVFRILMQN